MLALQMSAEGKNALLVWTRDGSAVAYALSERPSVRLSGQEVTLIAGDTKIGYPLSDYVRMSFGRWDFTGVNEGLAPKAWFRIEEDRIIVCGLQPGEAVSLYSTGGLLLWNGQAGADGGAVIPLSGDGIYVVKVSNIHFKLDKK